MRRGELFVRGITAIDGDYWSIAWSSDSVEDGEAIHSALDDAGVSAFGSFSRGRGVAGTFIGQIFFVHKLLLNAATR